MGKLDMSVVQAAKAKMENRGNQIKYDKLTQGKNIRRILFPKGDNNSFYSEGFVHFAIGEKKRTYTCPKTFDPRARCPICEASDRLRESKDKNDKQLGDAMRARKRAYVNVINRDSDNEIDEPIVLPVGATILKQLLGIICDPDYGDITDFDTGRDITIKRSGTGLNTEYDVLPKPNTSVASTTVSMEHLDNQMTDLNSLFKQSSYEELKAELYDEVPDEDEPVKPVKSSYKEESNYDNFSVDELIEECARRGINTPPEASRMKLVTLLLEDDTDGDPDVLADIEASLKKRKSL